jgi:hypothetical protein
MSDFPSIAFQSSLGIEAILFGVFGFLYSVYATYSVIDTSENLDVVENLRRAPIVRQLKRVCRFIALLIAANALLTVCSLALQNLTGLGNIILGTGLVAIMVAIAIFSGIWAWKYIP